MSTVRAKLSEIVGQSAKHGDPKKALLEAVGSVEDIDVFHNQVLVATYIGEEKTAGGIILPDQTLKEGRFQGKAALVLKTGPLAFKDDSVAKFGGKSVKPGDWVMVRPSDGLEFFKVEKGTSKGTSCRLFEDVHIKARIADPALIY
jgi:co-chaperonin GroES (HSP10)